MKNPSRFEDSAADVNFTKKTRLWGQRIMPRIFLYQAWDRVEATFEHLAETDMAYLLEGSEIFEHHNLHFVC